MNARPTTTEVRADRMMPGSYRLAPPVRLDSGAWRFEAVASTPGVNRYDAIGRVEYVTPEAISDAEYLDQLRGAPVIDDPALHWEGVDPATMEAARIGTVTGARWDDEQQATIVEITVDRERGIKAIRSDGIRGLSVMYRPDTQPMDAAPDGTPTTHYQTARSGINHILLTPTPNDPPARIRADHQTGGPMAAKTDREALIAQIRADMEGDNALDKILDMLVSARMDGMSYKDRADKAEADLAAMRAEMEMAGKAKEEADKAKADEAAKMEPRADAWRDLFAVASARGVEIKSDDTLIAGRDRVISKALPNRADAHADVPTAALWSIIKAVKPSAPTARADVWASFSGSTARGDASGGRTNAADLITPTEAP